MRPDVTFLCKVVLFILLLWQHSRHGAALGSVPNREVQTGTTGPARRLATYILLLPGTIKQSIHNRLARRPRSGGTKQESMFTRIVTVTQKTTRAGLDPGAIRIPNEHLTNRDNRPQDLKQINGGSRASAQNGHNTNVLGCHSGVDTYKKEDFLDTSATQDGIEQKNRNANGHSLSQNEIILRQREQSGQNIQKKA